MGASTTRPREGDHPLPAGGVMPVRTLGRTGERVSLLGLGGFHLGLPDEAEAIRIVHAAIDHGVTFLDNCWDYNGGVSEERMGKALLGGHRQRAFLMTKIDGRSRAPAAAQLEQSLRRLRTDAIDLVQIHEVIRDDDPDRCFSPGGAMEALFDAKRAGKVRYLGFTGHKDPLYLLCMLERGLASGSPFDAVQMPLNVLDPHHRSFEREVLPMLGQHDVAALAMKTLASGRVVESGAATAIEALHYAMSLPVSVVITGCESMGVLEQALHAALTFRPLLLAEMDALRARAAAAGAGGSHERFKTSGDFDGTEQNPKWLTGADV